MGFTMYYSINDFETVKSTITMKDKIKEHKWLNFTYSHATIKLITWKYLFISYLTIHPYTKKIIFFHKQC